MGLKFTYNCCMENEFKYSKLPVVEKEVFRLGLASNFGIDEKTVEQALEEYGMNYLFWTPHMGKATEAVKRALKKDRERYVIATGPTLAWWASSLRRYVEKALTVLETDYLDFLHMFWVGVTSSWKESTMEEMVKLREEGKVKAIGISIHNRKRAGMLAKDSPLDLFMIRYNAAHPGAEQDIFPHVQPNRHTITAYTATRWRKLLKRPKGWEGDVPTAGHCYRFCLSNPHVNVVLTGPKTAEQLKENVKALDLGPLDEKEMAWMREFGKVVHG